MADLPDFYKQGMQWPRRDWATKTGEQKSFYKIDFLNPDESKVSKLYDVPSGKIFYCANICLGGRHKGWANLYKTGGAKILAKSYSPWDMKCATLTVPYPVEKGDDIFWGSYNFDIIGARSEVFLYGWETPASEPEKPKSDDPEELYRCGEFNYCDIVSLPNNEQLFIFSKVKEGRRHYLRIKDYGLKSQKKIASFHLNKDEAAEILDIRDTNPEKVKEVLAKYEKKYGKEQ